MVLESLFEAESIRRNPLKIMLQGFVFVSVAVLAVLYLGNSMSSDAISILLVAMVALPSMPVVLKLVEHAELREQSSKFLGSHTLGRHYPLLVVLLAYFASLTMAFTAWYLLLPPAQGTTVFGTQINEIKAIGSLSARAVDVLITGAAAGSFVNTFEFIFLHNLEVLAIVFALSAVYGAGAVIVLAWNASVIAVFVGETAKTWVAQGTRSSLVSAAGYGLLGLAPHGTFELLAYSAAVLAGGILSSAIIHKTYQLPLFVVVLKDVAKLLAWAVLFLATGALIESGAITL